MLLNYPIIDMGLLADILSQNVLVMVYCSPSYEQGVKEPWRETKYIADCQRDNTGLLAVDVEY